MSYAHSFAAAFARNMIIGMAAVTPTQAQTPPTLVAPVLRTAQLAATPSDATMPQLQPPAAGAGAAAPTPDAGAGAPVPPSAPAAAPTAPAQAAATPQPQPITAAAIDAATPEMIVADVQLAEQPQAAQPAGKGDGAPPPRADPAIAKLQVMLDRAGASPGVIDGFFGDNVRKAIAAAETMRGLPADGVVTPALLAQISQPGPVMASYTITQDDAARIGPPVPTDYAEMAKRQSLGYSSIAEELAERFHMDQDLLKALNPGAAFAPGETISVDNPGANVTAQVVRIQADKAQAQVRAYDAAGRMVAAYPATIGSADNPSPSGQHVVEAVVHNPTYTYNPKINFKQGDNDKVLTIPAGPNGPVGSIWIDLSEPTYGIHGTPDPDHISKTNSHGCVRLTNWDAEELAGMVKKGTEVDFVS